jgi:hypothetical protein
VVPNVSEKPSLLFVIKGAWWPSCSSRHCKAQFIICYLGGQGGRVVPNIAARPNFVFLI